MATIRERIEYIFSGDTSGLQTAASKASGSIQTVGRSADRTSQRLNGLKRTAEGVGGKVGELSGRVAALGEGLGALGGVGVGVGLAAAAAVGVGLVAAAAVKLTRAADSAAQALPGMFPADQVERVRAASAALEAAGTSIQAIAVSVASNFAPEIEFLSRATVAAALATRDYFEEWTEGESIFISAINGMGRAFAPFVEAQAGYLKLLLSIRAAVEGSDNPLNPSQERQAGLRQRIRDLDSLTETLRDGVAPALEAVTRQDLVGYWDEAGRFIQRYTRETMEATEATEDLVKKIAIGFAPVEDPGLSVEKKRLLATEANTEAAKDYESALSALAGTIGELPGLFKENSRAAFIATKASALGQAFINTALAVTATLANPVQAALVGAAGAAQIAAIAAQPPPSFDFGGVVQGGPPYPGGNPRQRIAQVEDGEVILTRRMQDAVGRQAAPVVRVYVGDREIKRTIVRSGATDGLQRRRGFGQRRFVGAT